MLQKNKSKLTHYFDSFQCNSIVETTLLTHSFLLDNQFFQPIISAFLYAVFINCSNSNTLALVDCKREKMKSDLYKLRHCEDWLSTFGVKIQSILSWSYALPLVWRYKE